MKNQQTTIPAIAGGGEMGAMIRAYPWEKTSVGSPENWPQSLQTCLRIMLTSVQPIWIGWGKELIKFYNDPYKQIVGGKHPRALGQPAAMVWRDIWTDIGPLLEKVMNHDEGTFTESQLLIMERNGYPEETYFTFSYTPIPGDDGKTAGMFCANTDDTDRVVSERQLKTITELGNVLIRSANHEEVIEDSIRILANNKKDFPFALFRTIGDNKTNLTELNLEEQDKFKEIFRKAIDEKKVQLVEQVRARFGEMPKGDWPVSPDQVLVIPIFPTGASEPYGLLMVGVNPYRLLDEKYQRFYQLVADQISTSLAKVQALEAERRRAAALSEIDKAKTVFFTNISHEFRTPITLMLGNIEEALRDPAIDPANQQRLELAYRNAMRLLKLVNNLLDFSRIEAGKVQASFQLTDIARFTKDLVSGFRSIMDNAGLAYNWKAAPIAGRVFVDKSMWEKIVLNLISNAFKYTLKGGVDIHLFTDNGSLVFQVKDTGVGIPSEELPRMFQRFHRVQHVTGRTYEGTGIGLSLVNELVHIHGGQIQIESEIGRGSVFTVEIPLGRQHLPPDQVDERDLFYQNSVAEAFLEEAEGIVEDTTSQLPAKDNPLLCQLPKVLVVDDNPDMRQYLKGILRNHVRVFTANNGRQALELLEKENLQLILSDIMMPEMDGIELLKRVKSNKQWRNLPVILLSARVGEEEKIESYEIGADDYLVKPFSSKELISRVKSHLSLTEQRQREQNKLKQLLKQAPVGMCVLRGREYIVEVVNDRMLEMLDRAESVMLNKPVFDAVPDVKDLGYEEILKKVVDSGEAFVGSEHQIVLKRHGKPEVVYVNFVFEPLREDNGTVTGVVVVASEVTDQMKARLIIEESEERYALTVDASGLGLWDFDVLNRKVIASGKMAEIYGLASNEQYTLEHLTSAVHPDDKNEQDVILKNIEEGKIATTFSTEYRIIRENTGEVRWIRAKGKAFFTDEGILHRTLGSVADITSEKDALERRNAIELDLQKSEQRFRALVTATSDVVYRMNADWTEMQELQGQGFLSDTEQPTGNWIEKYIPKEVREELWAAVHIAISNKTMFQLEHPVLQANGKTGWTFSRAIPILDANKNIIEWFGAASDITSRRGVEEQLRKTTDELAASKQLYDAISGSTPDLIYVFDLEYNFIYANQAILNMWGRTWEESAGRKLREVGYEAWHAEMHEREIDQVIATKSSIRGEVSFPHAILGSRIYDYIFVPLFNEEGDVISIAGTTRDISDIKQIEQALKQSEEQFRTLTQSLPQLIWTASPDGYCDFFNQQWYDYTGSSPAESYGDGWSQYIHPNHRNGLYNEWQNCLANGSPLVYEFQLREYSGIYKWYFVIGRPILDESGKITKWVGALTNIDEQKAVEEKLETLVRERTRELQRSNDDLLKFAHVASHDLREPVRKVKTFASCLEEDADSILSEKGKTFLNKIYSAADRMNYMIEGVLTYSTITQNDHPFTQVNLNEIIEHIIADQEVLIAQKQARIVHESMPSISGAQMLLYQLFYNLINNALKFAKQDQSLVVRIASELLDNNMLGISVQDNGIGFPNGESERIFGSFTRLHSKDRYAGTGLGLSLCRQIAERHNGTIMASSKEGRGSCFLIRLPLQQA